MRRWFLGIILGFSLIGAASSWIATQRYFEIQKSGFEEKSFCNISEFVNCDAAFASSDARLGNIPVSALGFIYYLLMLALALCFWNKGVFDAQWASFCWTLSFLTLLFSLYKAAVATFVLDVLCLICLSIYFVNIVQFLAWHFYLKIGFKNWRSLVLGTKVLKLGVSFLIFMGISWLITSNIQNKILGKEDLGISTQEIVQFHFRQSQYQLALLPSAPMWGNLNAKITVVEFSDFQCPHCKIAAFRLKPILTEFKDKIRFYFYYFPIDKKCNESIQHDFHPYACDAAFAAHCAQKMGDFWEFHDDLFRNQKNISPELFTELFKKRGWPEENFRQCMTSTETLQAVKENVAAGLKIYIEGTPTILVNNRRVKYWMDPDILRGILEEEIRRAQ